MREVVGNLERTAEVIPPGIGRVALIDNHSPWQHNSEMLREFASSMPHVDVYQPSRPVTISEGLNYALMTSSTPFFVPMDDDTRLVNFDPEHIIRTMCGYAKIGILSPEYDGTSVFGDDLYLANPYREDRYPYKDLQLREIPPEGYLYGACMVMRKSDLKNLGSHPFGEPGAYGFHDILITEKLRLQGLKMVIDERTIAHHVPITISDPEISAWKKECREGRTRMPFNEWKQLHIDGSPMKHPWLKAKDVATTRFYNERVNGAFRRRRSASKFQLLNT